MNGRGARGTWVLVATILGSSMSMIDGTAVNTALPILQRDLRASSADVQWIVEGYSLFLSALILIGGSLGDRFGRRLMFGLGIGIFALASLGCALAMDVHALIWLRCLQGVGGALATPGSLALISATFDGEARGKAIGTWSGFSAMTTALGPLLGGALVQFGSWRYVFLINVPLAAVVIAILVIAVDESRDEAAHGRIDYGGAALATSGLGALVFGLIRLQAGTLEPLALAVTLAGAALCVAFVVYEGRVTDPMMQLELFASKAFSVTNAYTFLLYAALGGSLYFIPFDLINVQGYPPSLAGAALLPMIAIVFASSRFSGGLVARIGPRWPLACGAVLAAGGFTTFAFAGVGHGYWTTFFPGAVILGLGLTCFVAPLTTTVMDAVDRSHSGIASGINNAVSRAAGLIAVAALGISLAAAFDATVRERVRSSHDFTPATLALMRSERATIVAGHVPAGVADPVQQARLRATIARAYAAGFQATMLVAAALALLGAALAVAFLDSKPVAG